MSELSYKSVLLVDDNNIGIIPYVLPANTTDLGTVKPDNTSIDIDNEGTINVNSDWIANQVSSMLPVAIPVGGIIFMPTNYAPTGFLVCDGSVVQIQYYPALYAIIGTSYGEGGSGTFRVPALIDRYVYGTGNVNEKKEPYADSTDLVYLAHQHTYTLVNSSSFVYSSTWGGGLGSHGHVYYRGVYGSGLLPCIKY